MIAKNEMIIGGKTLSIETGRIAKQANGSAVVRYGDTVVFAAATATPLQREFDFFPLTVDYREKTYAAGKFPGGFFKREGRPTNKEILTCRLIDRPLRPLFPDGLGHDVAVSGLVLSADPDSEPDVLAINAAASAVAVSDIPFPELCAAVRVGRVDGQFIYFPSHAQLEDSDLDLVVAGTKEAVVMVEAGLQELSEDVVIQAIFEAHKVIRQIIELQEGLVQQVGKKKFTVPEPEDHSELAARVREQYGSRLKEALLVSGKFEKKLAARAITDEALDALSPEFEPPAFPPPENPKRKVVKGVLEDLKKDLEREYIIETHRRVDGRALSDIRPISIEMSYLPRTHGSAVFTRGETQAMVIVTLGTGRDEQVIDGLLPEWKEHFMLHYNFPAYCVGETWPNRGPKRREIGHGALAWRALMPVVPVQDKFPYTVRVVSEIMESNGSSSMATVCGGTLAMMDAGVKIRRPVAGIAMGMIKQGDEVRILSDILGSEDHNGDMDFKVAGTQNGITALQMDIKVGGISAQILKDALAQAHEGRMHILREMLRAIEKPRDEISPYAPRIIRIKIDPDKIGLIIGPGGKMIKSIQEETKATIEIDDDGTVNIWGVGMDSAEKARERIEALTEEVKPGRVYNDCRVVSVKDFGCFVEVLPGQEGLVHVSELGDGFVNKVSDVVAVGDRIDVKCVGVDNQGRIKLSKKAVLAASQKN